MARAPYQVLVIPFRRLGEGGRQFAVFRRADGGYWQGIAGGGEHGETPEQAARREAFEEGGIPASASFYRLRSIASIPVSHFSARDGWPADLYVIPEYSFGVDATGIALELSREHREVRWVAYEEGELLLYWQTNRVALWELSQRLLKADLPPALDFG